MPSSSVPSIKVQTPDVMAASADERPERRGRTMPDGGGKDIAGHLTFRVTDGLPEVHAGTEGGWIGDKGLDEGRSTEEPVVSQGGEAGGVSEGNFPWDIQRLSESGLPVRPPQPPAQGLIVSEECKVAIKARIAGEIGIPLRVSSIYPWLLTQRESRFEIARVEELVVRAEEDEELPLGALDGERLRFFGVPPRFDEDFGRLKGLALEACQEPLEIWIMERPARNEDGEL